MARQEIDPQLPFIQVERGVGAKAALLATELGVTYQHARGALDVFWEGLANRRVLMGSDGQVRDVVFLTEAELRRRLRRAFGVDVEPEVMMSAGFVEPMEGGYRVRGMSRYLNAERARLLQKDKPRPSGSRPAVHPGSTVGTPPVHRGSTVGPPAVDRGSTGGRPAVDRGPDRGSTVGPPAVDRGSTEVRLDTLNTPPRAGARARDEDVAEPTPTSTPTPTVLPTADGLEQALHAAFHAERGRPYRQARGDFEALRQLLGEGVEPCEVVQRFTMGLRRTRYPTVNAVADLAKHWNACATDEPTRPKADVRKGRVRADSVDWSTKKVGPKGEYLGD